MGRQGGATGIGEGLDEKGGSAELREELGLREALMGNR
jgi:hypothetical protein